LVDSSSRFEIIAAEYLSGNSVLAEPPWLQYMREWGPKVVYDSREEIERLVNRFPRTVRVSLATVLRKLPVELSGEEGPTGPKEKNNWYGDERC
jgi:pre-mRNA-processing factor 39